MKLPRHQYAFNDRCLHDAPPASEMTAVLPYTTMLTMQLHPQRDNPAACHSILCRFAEEMPAVASKPGVDQMFISQAADAYADGEWAISKCFLRTALFFSAFRDQGEAFIAQVQGQPSLPENLESSLESNQAMLAELRSRIHWGCLRPRA